MKEKVKTRKVYSQSGIVLENIPEMNVMANLAIQARKAGRMPLSRINISDGVAMGSTGHMAIKYKSDLLTQGYSGLYDVEVSKNKVILMKTEATDFPNFEKLGVDELLKKEPRGEILISRDRRKNEQELLGFMIKTGTAMSREYTDLIVPGSYRVYNEGPEEMILFHSRQSWHETTYVIMPIMV